MSSKTHALHAAVIIVPCFSARASQEMTQQEEQASCTQIQPIPTQALLCCTGDVCQTPVQACASGQHGSGFAETASALEVSLVEWTSAHTGGKLAWLSLQRATGLTCERTGASGTASTH